MGREHIRINLDQLLSERGISKSKFSHRAELERTQLNNYANNKVTMVSLDVLARMCKALDCEVGDILEYVPDSDIDQS